MGVGEFVNGQLLHQIEQISRKFFCMSGYKNMKTGEAVMMLATITEKSKRAKEWFILLLKF